MAPKKMAPKNKTKPAHISQADWDAVDSRELTADDFARAKPAAAALPGLVAKVKARGRPKAAETKVPVTVRLDRHVVDAFKATGSGWQTRINNELAKIAVKLTGKDIVRHAASGRIRDPQGYGNDSVPARDRRRNAGTAISSPKKRA